APYDSEPVPVSSQEIVNPAPGSFPEEETSSLPIFDHPPSDSPYDSETVSVSSQEFTTAIYDDITEASSPAPIEPPGHDPCTRGPGYWCYNQTTAKECK
ncbi:hypothetical protein ILUMI_16622, partial [Ignelater luminosus]